MANTCMFVDKCPLFQGKMNILPNLCEVMKKTYCLTAPERCARLIARKRLGKGNVPANLLPNMTAALDDLLSKAG